MNFLNRAWRYVTRKMSKSILLGITFFMIGNLVLIGLGISDAAESAKTLTRKSMRAVVNYEVDYDKYYEYINTLESDEEINEAYKNYPSIKVDVVEEMAKDERVKAVNFSTATIMYSNGFDNVPVGNEDKNNNSSSTYRDEFGNEVVYVNPNIMIQTNIFPNMIELEDGTYEVLEGRMYSQEDIDNGNRVALVTKELAELNGLKVGDTITLSNFQPSDMKMYMENNGLTEDQVNMNLEIIGIYNTKNDVDPNSEQFDWMQPYESPKNFILLPHSTYAQFNYDMSLAMYNNAVANGQAENYGGEAPTIDSFMGASKAVFLLNDPLKVDQFVEDNTDKLIEYTKLNANNEQFKKLAKPLDTLSLFANVIVWIVTLNAVVIISLVTALTLKTREFEIGVLLSLGVSKVKVVLQMFVELLIVAFLGFTLAVGTGSLIAGKVGDMVLDYQKNNTEEEITVDNSYQWAGDQNYFTEVTQDDILSQYHVTISVWIIIQIYVMGIAVVFVSILVPSAMIMRLNPKQILLA
ncbi:ABC transporter permease [Anaerorhabdus sp.]|uniref:ABC transporter permease n=1 Tax=Anaerorhabdus sp. TaxID=1872524 RepID=UPI002FC67EE1